MSKIELKHIDKYYGKNHVLKDINLVAEDGDFLTLLGPSGCGKTTTLRVVAGLENPQGGDIYLDGKNIVNAKENYFVEPGKRGMDLVFQSYALWPHMTVYDNVAFGLVVKKQPKDEIRPKVMNALERMRIAEFAKRYPSELSGGQQQRVAIARSIVSNSNILLLDEPLSNLDAKLRIEMRSEIKRLHHDLGTTILYVTHDQVEALTMSTKIAIDFIGNPKINFIDATAKKNAEGSIVVTSALGSFVAKKELLVGIDALPAEFDAILGIRPEKISILTEPAEDAIMATVYSVQPAGSETTINLKIGNSTILAKDLGIKNFDMDQTVYVRYSHEKANVFHKESGRLIKKVIPD